MEATGLGLFMVSAGAFGILLEHPASAVYQALPHPVLRRMLMGLAMGLTAIAVIYSPWGKRSGAHINPCVTLTFFRLGKIERWDAFFYVGAQFAGAAAGILLLAAALTKPLAHPSVNYVATVPGPAGVWPAFLAEGAISFGLMLTVLLATNTHRLARYTGLFAGALIAVFITLEAPISGMSMNPARSLASALPSRLWTSLWVYFSAPVLGMLSAAELYVFARGSRTVRCAKLHHFNSQRCIFRCGYKESPLS